MLLSISFALSDNDQINGESTSNLTQREVVDRLKTARIGDFVSFLVSRVPTADDYDDKKSESRRSSGIENRPPATIQKPPSPEHRNLDDNVSLLISLMFHVRSS